MLNPTVSQVRQEAARQTPLRRSVILGPTPLTTTAAALLTAEDDDVEFGALYFANITASPVTITVHIVADGDTAADSNAIVKAMSVAANDRAVLAERDKPLRLAPGETLQALASEGASINAYGSGYAIGGEG